MAIFVFGIGGKGIGISSKKDKLIISGKLGTEPEILINMYKLLIEEESDIEVELKVGMGTTTFVFNALNSKNIDIYPEFTGTAVFTFLKEIPVSNEEKKVFEQAKIGMEKNFNMEMLSPMKYNNTYAIAVPRSFAEENKISKISDLEKIKDKIKAGFTREFNDREDGYLGLKKLYGFELKDIKEFEPKLRYVAIQSGDINLIDAYSTDSEIAQYDLIVLEDDKKLFPPYQGAPLMRKDTLEKYPQLKEILGKLNNKISDSEMSEMNYKVAVKGEKALDVAKEYLKKEGLIK